MIRDKHTRMIAECIPDSQLVLIKGDHFIAAKNPEPEESKYEIADFLYHVMVLMALKGLTWEDVMEELANR